MPIALLLSWAVTATPLPLDEHAPAEPASQALPSEPPALPEPPELQDQSSRDRRAESYFAALEALAGGDRNRRARDVWELSALMAGTLAAGVPLAVLGSKDGSNQIGYALCIAAAADVALVLPWSFVQTSSEKLWSELGQKERSQQAVQRIRAHLFDVYRSRRRTQILYGTTALIVAAAGGVTAALLFNRYGQNATLGPGTSPYPDLGGGALLSGLSAFLLVEALYRFATLSPVVNSLDDIEQFVPRTTAAPRFSGASLAADAHRLYASASFAF